MRTLTLEIPEETFASLPFPPADFARRALLAACVKSVEAGHLSQSRASEICQVSREAFLHEMSSYAVWVVNSSPLIVLGKAGGLHFLADLATTLIIPRSLV
jgi:hypothetical protein